MQKSWLELQGVQESENWEFQEEEQKADCMGGWGGGNHSYASPVALKSHKAVILCIELLTEPAFILFFYVSFAFF